MNDKPKPTQPKADEIKAEVLATDKTEAKKETVEARKDSKETLAEQETARPEPTQEECNRMREAVAGGGMKYKTRQAKAR